MNIKVEREDGGPPVAHVECMDTDTIARFKDLLKERTRIPVEEQHLLYKMEELENSETLGNYGIAPCGTLQLKQTYDIKILIAIAIR